MAAKFDSDKMPDRQSSEPAPDSEHLPEKRTSFLRQVSDPGPEGKGQLPFLRRQMLLQGSPISRITGRASCANLLGALKLDAEEKKNSPPWALIAGIIVFNIIGKVGDAVGPAMVGSYPISLLFLNASNTHCILTTTSVAFVPWLLICVGRRFAEDPLYFYAGWKYREACLGMLRDYSEDMADGLDKAEEMFKSNLYLAVVLNPGATVCSLAGASRMPPIAFFTLNIGSTAAQLLLMRYICEQFPDKVDWVLGQIKQYMLILLAVMVGITLVGALPMLRKSWSEKKKKED